MTHVYRSRVDWWLGVIIGGAMAISLAGTMAAARASWPAVPWAALPGLVLGLGLCAWVLLSTRYTLDARELRVRSGPFSWRIPLAEIRGVTRTSNPLSSPALSLRRLRIEWGDGRALMISPRREEEFLRELDAARSRLHRPASDGR